MFIIFFLSGLILSVSLYTKLLLTSYAKEGLPVKVLPGEFEKQQSIWIMWPSEIYNQDNQPVNPVIANIIKKLIRYVDVNIIAASKYQASQVRTLLKKYGCSSSKIHYHIVNHYSIWARDVGPIFVRDNRNQLSIVNFRFNNYGRYGDSHYINTENQVDVQIGKLLKLPVINSKLVSEGGSVESNGKGTIMLTESVALSHNTGLTKKQIEDEYKRVLGAKKIIWLKNGLAEDKVTGGHVDEFVRFADAHTILLARVLSSDRYSSLLSKSSHTNLEENYKILLNATDQDGKPFTIIRVPMPPTLYRETDEGYKTPVRSYLNYVAANGAVLMPTYWKPGRPYILKITEEKVIYTFKSVFPERDIVTINAETINAWGGGIHCVTQHMPVND